MASENETIAEIEEELRSGEYAPLADLKKKYEQNSTKGDGDGR